ncbi:MAG: wax ester/triacylglycerol synthase domain-containing protein [Oryzihumus sp.]
MAGTWVDRASADDLMALAADHGPVPMQVGALLLLGAGADAGAVAAAVGAACGWVPRLRQRLVRTPPGCGRPVWVEDAGFRAERHVRRVTLTGDLLELTAALVTTPLPRDRPLWAAVVVEGLPGGGVALVLVMHHVVSDGVGGLAVLGALADATQHPPARAGHPARPTTRVLLRDAWTARAAAVRRMPLAGRRVAAAATELGLQRVRLAARTSLNVRTGPRRRLLVVSVPLAGVRAAAHQHGATVNDEVVSAIGGALGDLVAARGEPLAELVVSVPVSARTQTSASQLGNQVGAMPVTVDLRADRAERLRRVAALTAARRAAQRGGSAALLVPAFRLLATLGLFRLFVDHQRLVHTFVSDLRGPVERWAIAGVPVEAVVPVAPTPGNVTVSFGVLSYAGTLAVAVLADPERVPDLDVLGAALARELDALAGRDAGSAGGG